MARRRSPSVTMPTSRPAASTTPRQPKRFSVISSRARSIGVSGGASGIASPPCIRSRTRRSRAPSRPPGWNLVEIGRGEAAAGQQGDRQRVAERHLHGGGGGRARAPSGRPRRRPAAVSATSAAGASVEPARAVIATSGRPKRREWATRSASSAVSPELDRASTASPGDDHAQVAVRGLGRMDEQRRRAGRGEGGGDLAGDLAGLAHAGDHHAAGGARQQLHRVGEAAGQAGGQRMQPGRLGVQHRAGDFEVATRCLAERRWRQSSVARFELRRQPAGQPAMARPGQESCQCCEM